MHLVREPFGRGVVDEELQRHSRLGRSACAAERQTCRQNSLEFTHVGGRSSLPMRNRLRNPSIFDVKDAERTVRAWQIRIHGKSRVELGASCISISGHEQDRCRVHEQRGVR